MKHSSLGGNNYVVIFVDDYTHFKVVKFVKKKSDTTAALLSMVVDYITPQKLSIKCIRTDNGGEFEGEFRRELDRRSIMHEHTPPDTPQYNGVAEQKLWAQAMLFACDVTNKSVTTSTNEGKSPYELWFGKPPTAYHLRPFGTVGYARQSVREHKMAPKEEKCVFMGRDGTGSDDRGMKPAGGDIIVERGTPQLNVQELGQEQHEHEWQEAISELEGEAQGALSDHGEDTQEVLSEDEREQQHEEEGAEARSASLEEPTVPALRKLAIDGNMAMQATLDVSEPRNRRQAMESHEWDE
ncbi:unnamed protein product [Ascophyllum nodosum]